MANDFFRQPTEDEKRDFSDIGPSRNKDAKSLFLGELGKKRNEAAKGKIPFFKKAPMDDFDDYYKEAAKASMRKNGYVKVEDIKPIAIDWNKYCSTDNIEFVEVEEIRDANVSKKHPFDVLVKAFRYKYKGYGEEGVPNMSVMEDEVFAVRRARSEYENKPEMDVVSLAETNSALYGNKEARTNKKEETPKTKI